MLTILPQLRALGAAQATDGLKSDEFWHNQIEICADIFTIALSARGLMLSSLQYYEHEWPQSGVDIDNKIMEQRAEWTDPGRVKFARYPILWVKEVKKGPRILVTKASVERFRE
jgi:hypothetical protein